MSRSDELAERLQNPASVPYPAGSRIGGTYKSSPEDFVVEEQSLYDPDGRPGHMFLWIEKRDMSTAELVRRIASQLQISQNMVGTAGLKDRLAVTRQWVSIPENNDLDRIVDTNFRVLQVERNSSRLKTGELSGNRFRIVVRGAATSQLELTRNFPNYFGAQRFGTKNDTHQLGFERLREGRADRSRLTRLALSAAQSALFNAYLAARVEDATWNTMLDGDRLIRTRSGGAFLGTPAEAAAAVAKGTAVVAGPMFGPRMMRASGDARARELAVLAGANLDESQFARLERITPGTRRPLWFEPNDANVQTVEPDALELIFTLPPGTYATVLLDALGIRPAA